MKLRNKKTGNIYELNEFCLYNDKGFAIRPFLKSLAELNEEWEDYEEPKEHYFIAEYGEVFSLNEYDGFNNVANPEDYKSIGNYFETEEEAKKAVEKLKIYNKLKQKGFVFSGWYYSTEGQLVILADNHEFSETEPEDLTELFGDKIC